MPVYLSETTKREARTPLSQLVGDYWPLTTSGAGNAGGTTVVFSSLSGLSAPNIINKYLLLTSGTDAGNWRFVSGFTVSSGTMTVPRAYSAQVASSVTAELHEFRPDLYTQAITQAIRETYPFVYRPILSHIIPGYGSGTSDGGAVVFRAPRNMRDVLRVMMTTDRLVKDRFDRADSTTDPGAGWNEATGNWGVSSEEFYSVDDANGDLAIRDDDMPNGLIQAIVRGTMADASTYRTPAIVFRCSEDRNGDVPAAASRSYLVVRLKETATNAAGAVDLRKVDGGTETSLAEASVATLDATRYLLRVEFQGRTVRVWVDDVMLIDYELTGLNEVYTSYGRFGLRWDTAGAPATAARVNDFQAWSLGGLRELDDWQQDADRIGLRSPAAGLVGPHSTSLLQLEGRALLTAPTDDTTFETLDTDTTDRMEISTSEPTWALFLTYAAHALYEQARQASLTEDQQAHYAMESERWLAKYQKMLGDHRTKRPVVVRRSLF